MRAVEIVRGIEAFKFTARDVVAACLERIEARNSLVRAWEAVNPKLDRVTCPHSLVQVES